MLQSIRRIFFSKAMLLILIFGFMNGLCLVLVGNTLNFWLLNEGIDKAKVGAFSIIFIPYAINFIWAPLLDVIKIPILSKHLNNRISWAVLIQVLLAVFIYNISTINIQEDIYYFAINALVISFLSASQEIALGSIRAEILEENQYGSSSGLYIFGYRIGMLFGSAGAIYFSAYYSFKLIYRCAAVFIFLISILNAALSRNIEFNNTGILVQGSMFANIFPVDINCSKNKVSLFVIILIFLILYRLPDNLINTMLNAFLKEQGFTAKEIASAGLFAGALFSILGGFIAGILMEKMSSYKSLLYFGIIHIIGHMAYLGQCFVGHSTSFLVFATGLESITGGMAMAAYFFFITSLCKGKYKATQYSLFAGMMGVSKAIIPSFAGLIAENIGWVYFFVLVSVLAVVPLLMVPYIFDRINFNKNEQQELC